MHDPALRVKACRLRRNGCSYTQIGEQLGGIPKSTVKGWVQDVVLSEAAKRKLAVRRNTSGLARGRAKANENAAKRREAWRQEGLEAAQQDEEWRLVAALYWAEGGKQRNVFDFSNSDADMLRLVLCWLLRQVSVDRVTFYCAYHEANGLSERSIKLWWLKQLSPLTTNNLRKFTVWKTEPDRGRKPGKLPHGVARLTVCSTELRSKIGGAIDYLRRVAQ